MKKLKVNKIIALLIISVIIVMLLTIKSDATTVTTGLEATSSVQVGDTVSVYVTTTGTEKGILGVQGKISFDTTKLEFVSKDFDYNPEKGIFIVESIYNLTHKKITSTTPTRLGAFKFKVKEGATGTANVTLIESIATEATTETNYTTLTGSSNVVKGINIFVPNASTNTAIDNTDKVITIPVTSTTTPTTGSSILPNLPTGSSAGTGALGTGSIIKIPDPSDPSKTIDYTLLVKYDLTGDGLTNTADLFAIRKHILQEILLTGNFLKMADVKVDSTIDITDVMMMKMFISKL